MWVALLVLLQAMKWPILEKLSAITKIEFLFLWVLGKQTMKSILTSTQERVGTGKGVYKPWRSEWVLATWQIAHLFKMS